MYSSFSEVIQNWPGGTSGFARDAGIGKTIASSWRQRDILPAAYWLRLITNARTRGFMIDLDTLARLEARKLSISG